MRSSGASFELAGKSESYLPGANAVLDTTVNPGEKVIRWPRNLNKPNLDKKFKNHFP